MRQSSQKKWGQPTTQSIRETQKHQQRESDIVMQELGKRKVDTRKTAVNSAAIQDHLIRGLNIKQLDPFKKKPLMPAASGINISVRNHSETHTRRNSAQRRTGSAT